MAQHRPEFFQTPKPPTAAAGAAASGSGSPGPSEFSGERVIPIHICTDEEGTNGRSASSASASGNGEATAHANSSSATASSSDCPKSYATQRNNTAEIPRVKEISRNQRAQSAPPSGSSGINMTHCGGGQSKKNGNTAGREIPIQIEINSSKSCNGQPVGPKTGRMPHANKSAAPTEGVNVGEDTNKASEQESKPTPPKKPLVLDPMDKIKIVAEQVRELAEKVNVFNKNCSEKDYLYLDEMLTRCLIQLDDVEVEGKDDLRQARREVIKSIQKCISDLEVKAEKQPMNADVTETEVEPMAEDTNAAGDVTTVAAENPNENNSAKNPEPDETKEDPSKVNKVEPMTVDQDEALMNGAADQTTNNTSNQENSAKTNAAGDTKTETQQPPGEKGEEIGKTEDKKSEAAKAGQEPQKMET